MPVAQAFLVCFLLAAWGQARVWNNTGHGTIAFEEAWTIPELLALGQLGGTVPGQPLTQLQLNALDIHNQRLQQMDTTGVDFMILSCAFPCVQGISDPQAAAAMAITVNDKLAAAIANNTMRFGGFATVAMHDPAVAAQELKRAITRLGFLGALVNDFQQSGPDNALLFFDQPQYDVFWQMVTDLDVPVYFHPRTNIPPFSTMYDHAPWLIGPAQEFAVTLSNHILGLCTNGVFDRFPNLKIIVGHLGERISSDLVRIDERLRSGQAPAGVPPMQKNVTFYWHKNIFETTSGNFATDLLQFHKKTIGLDRILYSIDYPFVEFEAGQDWINQELPASGVLSRGELAMLKRGNAIKLFKLDE